MTKQEEIKEWGKKFLQGTAHNGYYGGLEVTMLGELSDLGVVIKVDRDLPEIAITTNSFPVPCNEICHRIEQENMLEAGYVAVEPLIKEVK